jgi:hypothetical protein
VLGDDDAVLVFHRELIPGVELDVERRHVRAEVDHGRREFGAFMPMANFGSGMSPW